MAALLVIAVALGIGILQKLVPAATTIPNSRLVFDKPLAWHDADPATVLDPAWAVEQKRRYPQDAALIDGMVDAYRSGRIGYSAFIDIGGTTSEAVGWVDAAVFAHDVSPAGLAADARATVNRQPVNVIGGATAVDVVLPVGRAARLDWSYDTARADGRLQVVYVRAYWVVDGPSVVAIQLVTYGARPEVVAIFDAVAATFRWRD
jgi:hypothetical protein